MQSDVQRQLWARIQAHPLDQPDAVLPISRRLARENDWSQDFALGVIEEYRRFVFLAMVAGHPVTHSDQVDQAWHHHSREKLAPAKAGACPCGGISRN